MDKRLNAQTLKRFNVSTFEPPLLYSSIFQNANFTHQFIPTKNTPNENDYHFQK